MTLTPEELIESNRFESLASWPAASRMISTTFWRRFSGGFRWPGKPGLFPPRRQREGLPAAKGLTKQLLTFAGGNPVQTVLAPIPC